MHSLDGTFICCYLFLIQRDFGEAIVSDFISTRVSDDGTFNNEDCDLSLASQKHEIISNENKIEDSARNLRVCLYRIYVLKKTK